MAEAELQFQKYQQPYPQSTQEDRPLPPVGYQPFVMPMPMHMPIPAHTQPMPEQK
jgi:hypothetical protein